MGYIYLTTNLINNKKYVGMTTKMNPNYFGSGKLIRRAINKYGKENFTFEILEYADTFEELCELERKYIKKYNAIEDDNFYNVHEGGNGGCTMKGYTEEEKRKYNENMRNIISSLYNGNIELRNKVSEGVKHAFDKNGSREKISKSVRERYKDENNRKITSITTKKAYQREDVRENLRKGQKKAWDNEERRKKYSDMYKGENNPNFGNTIKEEHKKILAIARKEVIKNSVYMCDENWNVIKEFDTKGEALEYLGLKGHMRLNEAIREKKKYKSYYWKAKRC